MANRFTFCLYNERVYAPEETVLSPPPRPRLDDERLRLFRRTHGEQIDA